MTADARWDAFLANIHERSEQVLGEALDGTAQYIDQPDFDPIAVDRLWTSIRNRLIELRRKIADTWSASVASLYIEPADADRARMRGTTLEAALERDFERAELRAHALVGRWIERRAAELRVTEAACMRCGGRHSVVGVRATDEWTCPSCHATATFQPSTFEYQLEHAAASIARDRAFDARGDARAYWQAYLAAVAEVLPERAATIERDVAAKLAAGEPPP